MWFWYASASAILSALVVVLNKKALGRVSASLVAWSLFSLNTPIVAIMAWGSWPTKVNKMFFVGAIGSALIFSFAKTLGLAIIKKGILSKLAPLTVFNTVFTYLLALVFLSESLTKIGLLGLVLITLGAYVLNAEEIKNKWWQPFKLLLSNKNSLIFLLAIFLTSVTAIFDKISITNSFPPNPALTLLMENLVITLLLLIYMEKRKPDWKKQFKKNWKELSLMSGLYGVSNVMVFSGFSIGSVALVVGIKQLQVFLVLLLGLWILKDKPTKYSLWASIIMIAGAVLIKLA